MHGQLKFRSGISCQLIFFILRDKMVSYLILYSRCFTDMKPSCTNTSQHCMIPLPPRILVYMAHLPPRIYSCAWHIRVASHRPHPMARVWHLAFCASSLTCACKDRSFDLCAYINSQLLCTQSQILRRRVRNISMAQPLDLRPQ